MEYCQDRNSSTVSVYRLHASSSESRPPRTAATTSALRRITQRLVPGAGKSAIVRGEPSGPITYLTLGRWGSVIVTLTNTTMQQVARYVRPLKIWLSVSADCRPSPKKRHTKPNFPSANAPLGRTCRTKLRAWRPSPRRQHAENHLRRHGGAEARPL